MSTVMDAPYVSRGPTQVPHWPSERPLFLTCLIIAIPIWILIIVSIIGLIYGLFIGLFILIGHALFVYHVRANSVHVGPHQLPEIHARVAEIADQFSLDPVPDAYVMQAGGLLNALATKFLGRHMIVLYSELLEAAQSDPSARDMIIGHELGHIKAGHLNLRWLIAPALIVPFLGSALSRAREYTCDRYGRLAAGGRDGAELGLVVLAAGGRLARHVNREEFQLQGGEISGFWMSFANLLASHPPLTKRVAALQDFDI